jgi:hypothetical protein
MQAIYTISYELVHIIQKKWAQSKSDSLFISNYAIRFGSNLLSTKLQLVFIVVVPLYFRQGLQQFALKLFRWTSTLFEKLSLSLTK